MIRQVVLGFKSPFDEEMGVNNLWRSEEGQELGPQTLLNSSGSSFFSSAQFLVNNPN